MKMKKIGPGGVGGPRPWYFPLDPPIPTKRSRVLQKILNKSYSDKYAHVADYKYLSAYRLYLVAIYA